MQFVLKAEALGFQALWTAEHETDRPGAVRHLPLPCFEHVVGTHRSWEHLDRTDRRIPNPPGGNVMAPARYLNPETLAKPAGNFSQVVQWDRVVWISGQVGVDVSGRLVGPGDAEAQTWQIYANVEAALKALGAGLDNLVKTVTYVVGRENVPGMLRVREALKRQGKITNLPASTLLIVAGLASPEFLAEMDAVAVLDSGRLDAGSERAPHH